MSPSTQPTCPQQSLPHRGRRTGRLIPALAAAAMILTLAGCGDDDTSGTSSGTASTQDSGTATAEGSTPAGDAGGETAGEAGGDTTPAATQGDTLHVAEQQPPNSLNPALADQNTDFVLLAYESLTYEDANGEIKPALAESWEFVGEGNTQLDLTLRQDAVFTDGSPVNAAAVKASLEYVRDAGGTRSTTLAGAEITATGDYTVSIKLASANPLLPTMLSQGWAAGAIISPTGLADPDSLDADHVSQGAGAYIYDPEQSVAGDHYTYTANPNYFDPSRQHFQTIVMQLISDQQTAVNAASTGQIDVFTGDYTVAAQAEQAGLYTVNNPTLSLGMILFDRDGAIVEPLGDVRVRQAINYAIDRDAIGTALLGEGSYPTTQLVLPGTASYSDTAAAAYPYDPEKAKSLLAEAGYPDGFEAELITASIAGFDTVAKAMAAQLEEVGISLNLTIESEAPTWVGKAVSGEYPVGVQGISAFPSAYLFCQQALLPTGEKILNPLGSVNEELDGLCAQVANTDSSQVAAIERQINEWVVDNAWFAPVTYSSRVYFVRPDIQGVAMAPSSGLANPLDYYLAG
ncbi:MAG: ABC transporter substrate-binding protein [Bifidobacteriaceae bacterium]|jgi:peptide/nickel transport system substrate-binding protein|nr:ABC transporter substrate-binding protein [Bifidobacteriaceae bacterium]